jgi:ADP-ribosylation factor GTPase-activating protein 1
MSRPALIPDKERDVFFKEFCKGANKSCIDCGSPNPQWATAYFGILFCLECSGKHRSLGTHLTFVRSISMDSWKGESLSLRVSSSNHKQYVMFTCSHMLC